MERFQPAGVAGAGDLAVVSRGWQMGVSGRAPGSHISGWMSEPELEWLFARAMQSQSIIEIGCWMGRSTWALCSGCDGIVYAVDNFQGHLNPDIKKWYAANEPFTGLHDPFGAFLENMSGYSVDSLRIFPMDSACASHNHLIPSTVDMVFLDGDHSYKGVSEDLRMWGKRAGKVLAGHDRDIDSVAAAVHNYKPIGTVVLEGPGSIWYVEIPNAS